MGRREGQGFVVTYLSHDEYIIASRQSVGVYMYHHDWTYLPHHLHRL
jgi:hypothetical protein